MADAVVNQNSEMVSNDTGVFGKLDHSFHKSVAFIISRHFNARCQPSLR